MERYFNITGCCNPEKHYMVNLHSRLAEIKKMIDKGQYFCINRGRQYGKTTTILALEKYLTKEYVVISMDFQGLSTSEFTTEGTFVKAFARELWLNQEIRNFMSDDIQAEIKKIKSSVNFTMGDLFACISEWCMESEKAIVLLIDEVDQASNNQVFLDFLAQLRLYYLKRNKRPTFQAVILAGVHDIRNPRQKIRPDAEHRHNSPWNIASSFDVDMSFSPDDIAGMLKDYENEHHTGMDISEISQLIYDYTSGYPVLVSTLCKLMDETYKQWTFADFMAAIKQVITERTPLFQ